VKLKTTILPRVLQILFLLAVISTLQHQVVGEFLPDFSIPDRAHEDLFRFDCSINRISPQSRSLNISCTTSPLSTGRFGLHFTDQFAGVDRLSERVFALKLRGENNLVLQPEISGDGLYFFKNDKHSQKITINYEMHLSRALDPSQYALVSTIGPEAGFLMLGDLLPSLCPEAARDCEPGRVRLRITSPGGWKVATTEKASGDSFEVVDQRRAIFLLGNFRERTVVSTNAMKIRFAVAGVWSFGDEEIFKLAEAIGREQAAIVEGAETGDFLVGLAPFPLPLTGLRSSAITVARTVVLQLNPNNNPAQTFAHFRRHLAHEMFHFYLPNAFRVRENFDWFWEGFTRYIALLTLVRLQKIGLSEYLDAIGEEYEAYAFNPSRLEISLINASPAKFRNYANYDLVYRKGMLVAALYDLELRWQSRGKYTVTDVMREIYQSYARNHVEIGNSEVLSVLNRLGDFKQLIRDWIEGTREILIAEKIKSYGLVVEWSPMTRGKVRISRSAKLSARQHDLMDRLVKR
jgi:predicted metalloprotease with PDZ domain